MTKSRCRIFDLEEGVLTFCVVFFYDFGLCFKLESVGRAAGKCEEILFQIRRQVERTFDTQWTKYIILA